MQVSARIDAPEAIRRENSSRSAGVSAGVSADGLLKQFLREATTNSVWR
jgi:hypothetical protein